MRHKKKERSIPTWNILLIVLLLLFGCVISCSQKQEENPLDVFFNDLVNNTPLAGLSAGIVKGDQIVWSKGYRWADIEKKIPMTPDKIQNIGSISKTVTATAVMQLWEKGHFKLDDDVNAYLPFKVEHPKYPGAVVTFRQLLAHRSAIKDGSAYDNSYSYGDPTISLETWITEYFTPGGKYYNDEENWHIWKPGEEGEIPTKPRAYSSLGYGLLGYLVERISGQPFSEYTKAHIFEPLGMMETSWYIRDIDTTNHVVPYTYISSDADLDAVPYRKRVELTLQDAEQSQIKAKFLSHRLYSFPNYPDGLLRTSLHQLARFQMAYINNGELDGYRLLKPETVDLMLSDKHFGRGLCWNGYDFEKDAQLWGHGGSDPGINTLMIFSRARITGVLVFTNTYSVREALFASVKRLLEEAEKLE